MVNIGNTAFMLICASLVMLMTPRPRVLLRRLGRTQECAHDHDAKLRVAGMDDRPVVRVRLLDCASDPIGTESSATRPTMPSCTVSRCNTMFTGNDAGIPLVVHVAYQMMFAIITPALITGAFANRVTFKAYFLFLTLWLIFVYFPFVHMLWSPDGMLAKWGVLDFAGGIVVHATAGFAALASVLFVGRRHVVDNAAQRAAHRARYRAAVVRLVRLQRRLRVTRRRRYRVGVPEHRHRGVVRGDHLARCRMGATEATEVRRPADGRSRRPCDDHACGRLCFADHCGRSSASLRGIVCYYAVALKNRLGWDDALDVWGVHGVGGLLGIVLARRLRLDRVESKRSRRPVARQPAPSSASSVAAALLAAVWAFVFTYGMLWLINRVTPVKVDRAGEERGLDIELHGEEAYPLGA